MGSPCNGLLIQFHVEPADRSVGIMTEGFSAWVANNAVDDARLCESWCELQDIELPTFAWFSNVEGHPVARPDSAALVEQALLGYVRAFYSNEPVEAEKMVKLWFKTARRSAKTFNIVKASEQAQEIDAIKRLGYIFLGAEET